VNVGARAHQRSVQPGLFGVSSSYFVLGSESPECDYCRLAVQENRVVSHLSATVYSKFGGFV